MYIYAEVRFRAYGQKTLDREPSSCTSAEVGAVKPKKVDVISGHGEDPVHKYITPNRTPCTLLPEIGEMHQRRAIVKPRR